MSIVLPPGYVHIDYQFRHDTYQRDAHVTMGAELEDTGPMLSAAAAFDAFQASLLPRIDSQVILRQVTTTVGQDASDPIVIDFVPIAGNRGGRSGDSSTVALAVLATKRTNLGGRRNQGRMFLPWIVADTEVSETGIITPSVVTSLQQAGNNFITELNTEGLPPVILHRTGGSPVPAPTPVVGLTISNVISTQRRRQVRNP